MPTRFLWLMAFVIDLYAPEKSLQEETMRAAPPHIQTLTQPTELFIAFVTLETNTNGTCTQWHTEPICRSICSIVSIGLGIDRYGRNPVSSVPLKTIRRPSFSHHRLWLQKKTFKGTSRKNFSSWQCNLDLSVQSRISSCQLTHNWGWKSRKTSEH